MATQVVLLERVENLGNMGDVVAVRPGYARNFLLPQKKALRASKENIAYFEAQKKHLEAENDKRRTAAEKMAKKMDGIKAPLIRQASEGGQLYGSVTSRDIADQVSAVSGEKIERSMVQMNQNFKLIGLFPVEIALHPEVKVSVIVNIARSNEEAEIQAKTGRALIADDGKGKKAEPQAEEVDLAGVLEEDALEAKKERDASESAESAEEAAESAAKAKARAEKKKAKKADEPDAEEAAEEA